MIGLVVQEVGGRGTVVAGVGSNDTRHAVELTEKATELGADALLSVNPYYNKPSRRGIIRHYEEIDRATDRPILLYNIPQRTASDLPNDLLAELGQLEHMSASSSQTRTTSQRLTDFRSTQATTTCSRTCSTWGSQEESWSPRISFGEELRRMVDEPDNRREIDESLQDVYRDLGVAPLACATKSALNLLGFEVGAPRLPYVELDEDETAVVRAMLERHGLLQTARA